MRRRVALAVIVLALAGAPGAAGALTPGGAAAPVSPDLSTTTTAVPAGEPEAGTSPWVLVLIGAAAGALVGTATGLARRRRAASGRTRGTPRPRAGA